MPDYCPALPPYIKAAKLVGSVETVISYRPLRSRHDLSGYCFGALGKSYFE